MNPPFSNIDDSLSAHFREKISLLYASMDAAYAETASHYGFTCKGCKDNCCEERFYHYTLAEHMYLVYGLGTLDEQLKKEIYGRAEETIQIYGLHDSKGIVRRLMCPLNFDGLCALYAYRPMICRLHGIPHTFTKHGCEDRHGPGCNEFNEHFMSGNTTYYKFDRTVFYSEMAAIEIELRRLLNFNGRYKKTVAGMIIDSAGR